MADGFAIVAPVTRREKPMKAEKICPVCTVKLKILNDFRKGNSKFKPPGGGGKKRGQSGNFFCG